MLFVSYCTSHKKKFYKKLTRDYTKAGFALLDMGILLQVECQEHDGLDKSLKEKFFWLVKDPFLFTADKKISY
jgi:hypothetical protein